MGSHCHVENAAMPSHSETKFLPYQPDQIFDLVADVARYPEFLPWCAAARIRTREPQDNCEVITADLVISFKVFRERFGSRVRLDHDRFRIDTDFLDGPFKHMHSFWQIRAVEGGCEADFSVDFEMKNAILQKVVGVVFNEAMQRVVRAFEARAQELYG